MRRLIFAVFTAALLMLTGCTSADRLHDTSYLRAVSIDGRDKKTLTLTFFTDEDSAVVSSGDDIESAVKNAELAVGKSVFMGYTELVILGDCDHREVLEYLLNEWKVPPSCIAVYSADGESLLDGCSAERLRGSVKRAEEQGKISDCGIVKLLEQLLEKGTAETALLTKQGAVGTAVLGEVQF